MCRIRAPSSEPHPVYSSARLGSSGPFSFRGISGFCVLCSSSRLCGVAARGGVAVHSNGKFPVRPLFEQAASTTPQRNNVASRITTRGLTQNPLGPPQSSQAHDCHKCISKSWPDSDHRRVPSAVIGVHGPCGEVTITL